MSSWDDDGSTWEIDSQDEDTIILKKVKAVTSSGGGSILVLALIFWFIGAYWFYIVSIGIIAIVCAVICFLISCFSSNPTSKIIITVILAIGLSIGLLYYGEQIQDIINSGTYSRSSSPYKTVKLNANYAYVASDGLNLRSGPSLDHYSIEILKKGERVCLLEVAGTWYKVRYNNIEGYVNSKYLELEE